MHGSGYASGSGSAWRLIRIQDPDLDPHHCFNKLMLTMLVIFSSECPPEDFLSFTVQTSDLHCSFSIAVLPAWTSRVLSSLPLKPTKPVAATCYLSGLGRASRRRPSAGGRPHRAGSRRWSGRTWASTRWPTGAWRWPSLTTTAWVSTSCSAGCGSTWAPVC